MFATNFRPLRTALLSASMVMTGLIAPTPALALNVGMQPYSVPAVADKPAIPVALFYPTQAAASEQSLGPFRLRVAMGAAPEARFNGLIVLSHGTGGSEFGHGQLAHALAADGYLVAALRHPGDNWQDRSLLMATSGNHYFAERPRQISRVIDALLADTRWSPAIARDARGPRVGAVGHSAGGYSVLALAGAQPDSRRVLDHCSLQTTGDPVFCGLARSRQSSVQRREREESASSKAAGDETLPSLRDARVRAVAALSPLAVMLDPASLMAIRVPVTLHVAELDRFLVPQYHGIAVANQIPGAKLSVVAGAGHFAFMDTPNMPINSEDGDIGADPAGFDRAAYLQKLGVALAQFFNARL